MAGVKVTDLNTLGTAAANDVFYIVDTASNESKQIEVGNVVNLQTAYDNGNTINGSNVIIEDSTGANIVAIGELAASGNSGNIVLAIGKGAGENNTGSECVFLGEEAGANQGGDNVIGLGWRAAESNALNGMFVISQTCMPSYADATAAATAITVALGARPGDYYLYHDQSDDTIKAVIPV